MYENSVPSSSPVQSATIPIGHDPQLLINENIKCLKIEKYQGYPNGLDMYPRSHSIKLSFYVLDGTEMKLNTDTAPIVISQKDLPLLIDTLKLFTIPLY